MPQDTKTQDRYEHEAKDRKDERQVLSLEKQLDNDALRSASDANAPALSANDLDARTKQASSNEEALDFLVDLEPDEQGRIRTVSPGTNLIAGHVYIDLRDRRRGALTATGQEKVGVELLVAKRDVDYALWNKLEGSSDVEPGLGTHASPNEADPLPADENAPYSATYR